MLASSLVILLAASPLAPAAQDPQALSLVHSPVGCMVAGTNPQLEAGLNPAENVQAGRVYFRSALGDSFYYVEMTPAGGHYVGVLPRPQLDAGPVTYYIEGVAVNYAQSQSPEQRAVVVEKAEDCKDKPAAALGPSDPVRVFSVGLATAVPSGFTGVSSVVATGLGGAAAAGAGAGAAAAGGSFFTSTAGIITMSAVAVGVATVVIVNNDNDNPPASPSQ
jgi:hypothetical protein